MVDNTYVYLTVDELHAGTLVHLMSGVDQETARALAAGAMTTTITGYTEWIGTEQPVVTLGWDWQMCATGAVVRLQRIGPPSSNLMLQSPARHNLGHARTALLLNAYVDAFDWQAATLRHIGACHSA